MRSGDVVDGVRVFYSSSMDAGSLMMTTRQSPSCADATVSPDCMVSKLESKQLGA